jgi:hypothetical protein
METWYSPFIFDPFLQSLYLSISKLRERTAGQEVSNVLNTTPTPKVGGVRIVASGKTLIKTRD